MIRVLICTAIVFLMLAVAAVAAVLLGMLITWYGGPVR